MAKQVLISNTTGDTFHYTMIETLDDIKEVFCNGPEEDLISHFNNGKTIIVNRMGGYCFFEEDCHTIIE